MESEEELNAAYEAKYSKLPVDYYRCLTREGESQKRELEEEKNNRKKALQVRLQGNITDYEQKKIESMRCHVSQPIAALEPVIILLAQQVAKDTEYKAAEVFRIVSKFHSHCFNLPVG